ncbi:MAG: formyltransferase family protein [Thermoflexales bacterium]
MTQDSASKPDAQRPLRIVTFNNMPPVFDMVRQWAERAGHTIVMVVTTPGPKSRRSEGYKQIVATAGEKNIEVLVTTRLKTVATPVLDALQPDLIVSASFPWLIPAELRQTARLGAVNMHPALLPAYRGPNALRQFYDAAPMIGATLHWMDDAFDTGRILSQCGMPLPRPCTFENLVSAWMPSMGTALADGVARAILGDPGSPQSETGTRYGAAFSEAEHWIDFGEPAFALQCKVTALGLFAPAAKARIGAEEWLIERLDPMDETTANKQPGTVLEQLPDGLIVQAGDGAVKIKAKRLAR